MNEKKYLKWYNKVGYGSGDIAGNVVYAFLSSFVMIYLTNTVGLNPGIIGTLIAVSKLFDGVTDVFFGSLIDKTKSRLGKARPWMLYGYIGCAVTLVAIFAIPANMGEFAQYAWFFIAYTLLNAVFYTANNIAYSALTALVTKNSKERVQMGSYRFIFAFSTSLLIQALTIGFVEWMGGGAAGWRMVAIVYAVIGLVVNTISVFSVKELPEEEFYAIEDNYILHLDRIFQNNIRLSQKHIKIAAILLIVFGVAVFWNGFRDLLFWILPNSLAIIIQDIMYQIPSVIIGILIIVAGYQLLTGKIKSISPDEKADCKKDVSEHYWQPYRPYQQPVDNSAPQMNTKSAPASTVSSTTQPDQNADNVIKNTDIKISDTTSVQPFITAEPDNNSAK